MSPARHSGGMCTSACRNPHQRRTPGGRSFRGSPPPSTMRRISDADDGALLGPIFQSSTHGYDATDYFAIDDRLGDESDFDALVRHLPRCRMRIPARQRILVRSRSSPSPRLTRGPDSWEGGLFRIDFDSEGGPYPWLLRPHGSGQLEHAHEEAISCNHRHHAPLWHAGSTAGEARCRYSVDPRSGRGPPARPRRCARPYLSRRSDHGDYAACSKRARSRPSRESTSCGSRSGPLRRRSFFELDWTLTQHNGFLDHFVHQTFIGNHDVTRIASIPSAPTEPWPRCRPHEAARRRALDLLRG